MKLNLNIIYFKWLFIMGVFFIHINVVSAQPSLPQRSITVQATQAIHFGTFSLTSGVGGTVTVGWNGIRSSTGDVFLSPIAPIHQPAIFEIKLCQGRTVRITYAPTTILTGSNGGSFIMTIGPTEKGDNNAVFPIDNNCNFITILRVGGTLTIPGNSPAGIYTGNFEISFDQE
jgi:hypothetical protein